MGSRTGSHATSGVALAVAVLAAASMLASTTTSGAEPVPSVVIDDFEDGDASDWFFFGGNLAGGGGGIATDRPQAGTAYLSTGWGGEGSASGFYGGAVRNFDDAAQVALPADPWFNIWVLDQGNATAEAYRLEVTLREDVDGNGWSSGSEDSFRLDAPVTSASFDDQWRLVSAPVSDFANLGTGGNGTFDGALDEVVLVIAGVEGAPGATVELDVDELRFSSGGPIGPDVTRVIDDFETGLPSGSDAAGNALGFFTFQGGGSTIGISTQPTPPAPVLDEVAAPNQVLQVDLDVTAFAGYIHAFENEAVDTWVPQDWSRSEGLSLWFHGAGSGTTVFVDILDNRNPGSTTDDAERFTVTFVDDVAGWQLLEFPFSSFTRKEIGNGAPNDGLGLFEMWGYAIGTLGTGGPLTVYLDEVSLYGVAEPPDLAVNFATNNNFVDEGTTGDVAVKLNRPMGPDDPPQVTVDFRTEPANATAGEEYTPTSGTLTFVNGGPSELSFPIETFDDTKFEGDERIVIRLSNPVGVERGPLFQASAYVADDDPYDPDLVDDFEQGAFLWDAVGPVDLSVDRLASDEAGARPGQDPFENVLVASVPVHVDVQVPGGVCKPGNGVVTVHLLSTDSFDATTVDHTTVRLGQASETHVDRRTGVSRRHVDDVDGDGLDDMVFHFRSSETGLACDTDVVPLTGTTFDGRAITTGASGAAMSRDFPIGQDWSGAESLSFWYEGSGSGDDVTVTLSDNRAPDPGPSGWDLVWSDEFDDPAGTPPDPDNWSFEIGDVTPDGKYGWGNEERQYYTDDPANASTDGNGNLVITLDEADGSLECYYGPCDFTSARLVTQHKAEFAYGRIESRLLVPDGGDGLWPAFWSLGTDIVRNPWPAAGEIDVMEYVSRLPNEIFGTIHGPGYNGGGSFSGIYDDFGAPVADEYHTFAVEWEPNLIRWFVDGIQYHEAEPSDVPGPWAFEKPFFLLLNLAIGGNFGGPVGADTTFPQEFAVDYVRVYQGPDTAERFEASFVDDVAGWTERTIPFDDFVRSDDQPAGAPDDGLGLDEVWGYGLALPEGNATGSVRVDLVRLNPIPPPTSLAVTTLADSGDGSLRQALGRIAPGGTITFDSSLAGGTIALTSGELTVDRSVTIDASATPGVVVSGSGSSRVFLIGAGATVAMNDLVIADGVAGPRGGGVLNLGTLRLERVVVRDNVESSAGPANFAFGGGGIYNGDGSTLNLTSSTVADNVSVNQPGGGIYGSFGSTIDIAASTVSGNVSGDVAGGLRSLGNSTVVNSTFSGNTSTVWHGGAIFHTDGHLTVLNSTFTGNVAPAGTASGILVATFGAPASMTMTNSVVEGNGGAFACATEGGGAATITSAGGNIADDASCNLVSPGDQPSTDPLLGPLADNGGPTLTHGLLPGSPAIDAAVDSACPPRDQRGLLRPAGAGCDVGSVEQS